MLHRRTAAKDLLRRFDWIGLLLFSASLFTFLMGLSWGGSVYPWKSGRVIGTIIGGAIGFAFFIGWEIFLPIGSEPYLPLRFFKNGRFQVCAWLAAIGSAVYYAYALIWPTWVMVMLGDRSWSYRATVTCLTSLGVTFGQILGGYIATFTGPKYGAILFMFTSVPVLAGAAYNPLNIPLTMGLITTGCLLNGMMETVVVTASTFPLRTQEEIGTAGGLAGSIRAFGSTIATTILSTILATRLQTTIPQYVVPAAVSAGLSATAIPALISGLGGIAPLTESTVPGLNSEIMVTAKSAYQVAHAEAFKTVFLANLAFGGVGLFLVWFVLNKDPSTEDYVAAHLHHVKDEEALEAGNVKVI